MNCEQAALNVLEDRGGPALPALEEHLGGCAACRELRAAHRAALSLQGLPVDLSRRAPAARPRPLWRSRVLRFGVPVVVFAAAAAWAGARWAPASAIEPAPVARAEADVAEVRQDALDALMREVDAIGRAEISADDPTFTAFGELPGLLAPGEATATRAFDRASVAREEEP